MPMIIVGNMEFNRAVQIIDDFLKYHIDELRFFCKLGKESEKECAIPESSCSLSELRDAYLTLKENYAWRE